MSTAEPGRAERDRTERNTAERDTAEAGWVAAVDLGATSGRVLLARVGPDVLEIEVVHRFPNEPVRTGDGLHWNVLELYRNVLVGLRKAAEQQPGLISVGIDSWAVDYALVRGDGPSARMTSSPYHYRDGRNQRGVDAVHAVIDPAELYRSAGLQFLPFNTIYQLAVDAADDMIDRCTRMLMVPDLLGYWLTGEMITERTNASTTGLLEQHGGGWNALLTERIGLPSTLLPRLVEPGHRVGVISGAAAEEIDAEHELPLVTVGSHDTASAVVAVPLSDPGAAYISSGTWSLVGFELDAPVLTDDARRAQFTNEGGVDGRVRFLHNVMGMWLLSESIRSWERRGRRVELAELLEQAARLESEVVIFDANDDSLLPAGDDMPERIRALCPEDRRPDGPAELVRSICESLAAAYADTIEAAERLSGRSASAIHVVGGGSQNPLLCQLTADRTGRPVLAGPVEATAIGNVLVQARTAGLIGGELEDLRSLVARTFPPTRYEPR